MSGANCHQNRCCPGMWPIPQLEVWVTETLSLVQFRGFPQSRKSTGDSVGVSMEVASAIG